MLSELQQKKRSCRATITATKAISLFRAALAAEPALGRMGFTLSCARGMGFNVPPLVTFRLFRTYYDYGSECIGSIDRAARLAAIPAGESPANRRSPVAVVVISSNEEGDRSVESLEVKVPEGCAFQSDPHRGASNLAGCSGSGAPAQRRHRV
jgi:hypothetical protein